MKITFLLKSHAIDEYHDIKNSTEKELDDFIEDKMTQPGPHG